ncbi:MAG TPA: shikimate dehydrogenase [Gemmataceae bacterium]|nr:shikimate dehydrogenase [Gemmataceae bacterium]
MPASPSERICVVVGRTRHKMIQAELQEAARRGARLIELRLDFLAKAPDFKRLLADKPCPVLATVRRPADGGRWRGSEADRQTLLRQAIVGGFDWVDIETDVADSVRRFGSVRRVVSYHNMHEVPPDLEKIHERMCKQDADVIKIAVRGHQPEDNLRVLRLVKDAPKPTIAFTMGDMSLPSRVLALKYGAPFTYAAFNPERDFAPGLPSFNDLKHVYHVNSINADTQVYGVIGDPVAHSLSPVLHNAAFRSQRINAVYLPFRVPRGQLESFLKQFDVLGVRGYSVTIPHKEAAALAATQKEPSVSVTQAANTLVRRGGGFAAHNTDYTAAVQSLLANLPPNSDGTPQTTLQSKVALILGAGGAARAVAHALHREGVMVNITNRTPERSQKLAEEIGCRAIDWAARHSVLCDVLINCTSVGMHPNVDETPVHHSFLKPGLVVMDVVYTPETTLLIREARGRGCHVVTGVDMFVRQAAAQFKLFTGQEPSLEYMRTVLRRALSPVSLKAPEELKK